MRLSVRRVRLGPLARVGCSLGWLISLPPALLASALTTWVLHGAWVALNSWEPWRPWPPGLRLGGLALPSPEMRPREVLHVEGLYHLLGPFGQHPLIAAALGALALTALGGLAVALSVLLAGLGYNAFARFTGGIELELVPGAGLGRAQSSRLAGDTPDWHDDAELDWSG